MRPLYRGNMDTSPLHDLRPLAQAPAQARCPRRGGQLAGGARTVRRRHGFQRVADGADCRRRAAGHAARRRRARGSAAAGVPADRARADFGAAGAPARARRVPRRARPGRLWRLDFDVCRQGGLARRAHGRRAGRGPHRAAAPAPVVADPGQCFFDRAVHDRAATTVPPFPAAWRNPCRGLCRRRRRLRVSGLRPYAGRGPRSPYHRDSGVGLHSRRSRSSTSSTC